ncbi:MAG: hypothetical protein J6M02_06300 [Clostridia bacterium]|nr:hypothetical protein [Clostridia bacterium]
MNSAKNYNGFLRQKILISIISINLIAVYILMVHYAFRSNGGSSAISQSPIPTLTTIISDLFFYIITAGLVIGIPILFICWVNTRMTKTDKKVLQKDLIFSLIGILVILFIISDACSVALTFQVKVNKYGFEPQLYDNNENLLYIPPSYYDKIDVHNLKDGNIVNPDLLKKAYARQNVICSIMFVIPIILSFALQKICIRKFLIEEDENVVINT